MNYILNYPSYRHGEDFSKLKNFYPQRQCPFGIRDLNNDECYSGAGHNRCKYFVRYDWDKYYGCILCNHPEKINVVQLELF